MMALGKNRNVNICGDNVFKIFYGSPELTLLINNKNIIIDNDSIQELKDAKRVLNELLLSEWLRGIGADYITPGTSVWIMYGAEPTVLKQQLLQSCSTGNIIDILTNSTNVLPIIDIIENPKLLEPNYDQYITFIASKKMSGTVEQLLKSDINASEILIAIMHRLNNMANATGIVHNDAKFANILYRQLATVTDQRLDFVQPNGDISTITIRSNVEIYLTDFEWGYCNYPLWGYKINVPEYSVQHDTIIPLIGSELPDDMRDSEDTYKYGVYYRGLDVIPQLQNYARIVDYSKVYPRLYTIDVLMFVTECLKYGLPNDRSVYVILNFYFANYVRISFNDTEPRYRGKVDYSKVSAYRFARDIQSSPQRLGL